MALERAFTAIWWFAKGWFWRMFPLYRNCSKKSFPSNAALAEESYDF